MTSLTAILYFFFSFLSSQCLALYNPNLAAPTMWIQKCLDTQERQRLEEELLREQESRQRAYQEDQETISRLLKIISQVNHLTELIVEEVRENQLSNYNTINYSLQKEIEEERKKLEDMVEGLK